MKAKARAVILGGGFAGLETAFMLRKRLGDSIDISIVSDRVEFLFKPNTIYIPFGGELDPLLIGLKRPLERKSIDFVNGKVMEVDPNKKQVHLQDGSNVAYDFLVIATGATMRPDEIPGLEDHAATIWTPNEMYELRRRLASLKSRVLLGDRQEVLFVVPPNNKCSGPLYEIVFMLETWLRRQNLREKVSITYSTYEQSFIQAFGPRLNDVVLGQFADRGIQGHTEEIVEKVRPDEVDFKGGLSRSYDLLISFPPYAAAVQYPALPSDERGFLTTNLETRQVSGHPEIYAPGDAGDFPVKQAFLAFLQADAVADHIAHQVSGTKIRAAFDPISMCVMEMLDVATFAQVPLQLTGNPDTPIEVRPGADDAYKVGTGKIWRLGKKALGIYLPLQFKAGRPFHAGAGWEAMNAALKVMSRILAD